MEVSPAHNQKGVKTTFSKFGMGVEVPNPWASIPGIDQSFVNQRAKKEATFGSESNSSTSLGSNLSTS